MNYQEQEFQPDYFMNSNQFNPYFESSNKITELSQIVDNVDQNQAFQLFQNIDIQSQPLINQAMESTPNHLIQYNYPLNNSLPSADIKNQQQMYFSNISPISRFQSNISTGRIVYPITGSSKSFQITPNNINNNYQTTKAFTPSKNLNNNNNPNHQTSSNMQNDNTSSYFKSSSCSRLNMGGNGQINNDLNNQQINQFLKDDMLQQNYYIGSDNTSAFSNSNHQFIKNEKNTQHFSNKQNIQNKNTKPFTVYEKDQDNKQVLMYKNQQLKSNYLKQGLNGFQEEVSPNFGPILAKIASPSHKENYAISSTNLANNDSKHSYSELFQPSKPLSSSNLARGVGNAFSNSNSSIISAIQNKIKGSKILSNQNIQQFEPFKDKNQKSNIQKSCQKSNRYKQFQSGLFGSEQSFKQVGDSIKNKNENIINKNEFEINKIEKKSFQESRSYLNAMKALQNRIKELEKQISFQNDIEFQSCLDIQYQQSLEQRNQNVQIMNEKNIQLEEQIQQLLNEIENYKKSIFEKDRELQIEREDWINKNIERNHIFESNSQKLVQLTTQLQQEIDRNNQMQIELTQTKQKWQLTHQELQNQELNKLEQLQCQLEEEKTHHNELKVICEKNYEELEILLEQNKSLNNKLQLKEKELDEYRMQFNQDKMDMLKNQIQEQKEYLDKIEEKVKIPYEQKQITLEAELKNAHQVEDYLRKQIIEIQNNMKQISQNSLKNNNQRYNNTQNQQDLVNLNSYQANNQNKYFSGDGQGQVQQNSPRFKSQSLYQYQPKNQDLRQNRYQNQYNIEQEQINPSINLQNDFDRYLSPSSPNNFNNIINNNQTHNNHLTQQHINYQNGNEQNINPQINNRSRSDSNQMNQMEYLSLQEESDLLNFDYDEFQQSGLNSKNSPSINHQNVSQDYVVYPQQLDSSVKRKSKNQQNYQTIPYISKQLQNQLPIHNSTNNTIYHSRSQQQIRVHSPNHCLKTCPFFTPSQQSRYEARNSPDFKNSDQNSQSFQNQMNSQSNEILKQNWIYVDQLPEKQISFSNNEQVINQHEQINNQLNQYNEYQRISPQNQRLQQDPQRIYMTEAREDNMNKQQYYSQQRNDYIQSQLKEYTQNYQTSPNIFRQNITKFNESEYKRQEYPNSSQRNKATNQSILQQQQQNNIYSSHNIDSNKGEMDDLNKDINYPTSILGNELIRDIFEIESELKLLNQRYEVLLADSRNEQNSKKKSEIRKEIISINERIKNLNDKLYILKKREKFIISQEVQKNILKN